MHRWRDKFWAKTEPCLWIVRPWHGYAVFVVLAGMCLAKPCFAQRVVLVRPPNSNLILTEAFNRLRAELNLQLFEVVVLEKRGGPDPIKSTTDAATEQSAMAAVSLSKQEDGAAAELCIVDRATGKTTLRTLALEDIQDAPAVLAIRAVDLLRTSLREFDASEPPTEIRGVKRVRAAEARKIQAWVSTPSAASVRVAGGMVDSSKVFSAAYGLEIVADYAFLGRARAGLWLMGPLIGAHYPSRAGTATIRQEMIAARLGYQALQLPPLGVWATLGIGAYHLDAHADVLPPLTPRRDQVFSLLGSFAITASLRLAQRWAIEIEPSAILLTPRPGVAVAHSQTVFRTPTASLSAGVRMDF
ncbi:MAG: hypothetical protein ACM3ZE_02955 [Myxococcales bacterium]